MKSVLMATAGLWALAAAAAPAGAQTSPEALRLHNELLQQQDLARLNALTAQAELRAAQDQLRTRQTLDRLEAARAPAVAPPRPAGGGPVPLPGPDPVAAEMERVTRATDAFLAQSNARLRAIRPASDH